MQETWVWSLSWEGSLEKEMTTHSSILAWRIPWKEEPAQVVRVVKKLPANAGDIKTQVHSLGQKDPLEKGMATHSSILTWRIPWAEKPGRLQPIGSQRVGHDWSDLAGEQNVHKHGWAVYSTCPPWLPRVSEWKQWNTGHALKNTILKEGTTQLKRE